MPNTVLDITGTLGTGLSATSNPDPNTLSPVSPYPSTYVNSDQVDAAWTSQAKPALFPFAVLEGGSQKRLNFAVIPTGGVSTTYTLTIWFFNKPSAVWNKPVLGSSYSYTGNVRDYIENPGNSPIFLQISNLSTGTLSIYFDASCAEVM